MLFARTVLLPLAECRDSVVDVVNMHRRELLTFCEA